MTNDQARDLVQVNSEKVLDLFNQEVERRGITYGAAALEAGVYPASIRQANDGKTHLTAPICLQIAEWLGIDFKFGVVEQDNNN